MKQSYDDIIVENLASQQDTIDHIGRSVFGVETLDRRKSDSLDFHDTAVWQMREALNMAFRLGQDSIMHLGKDVVISGAMTSGSMGQDDKAVIMGYIAYKYLDIDSLLPQSEALDHHVTTQLRVKFALVEAFTRGRESMTGTHENNRDLEKDYMDVLTNIAKEYMPFKSLVDRSSADVTENVNVNDVRKALSAAFDAGIASCDPDNKKTEKPRMRT